ncbi:MAG: hypothetical protein KA004_10380 [Verrucomicrobiales bacterium]|nr:hypothetical protein [Verrucomicrobiales bacterium]
MPRISCLFLLALAAPAAADVRLSKMFSDHMVLQRDKPVPVWGWAEAGEEVTVSFAGQNVATKADAGGAWQVKLAPLKTSQEPQVLSATGKNTVKVADVLVGEVWLCSGQSNMGMTVGGTTDGDLEGLTAPRLGKLRLITVGTPGSQEPVKEPDQTWVTCTPDTIRNFSAVGFYFGRQLLDTLDIPIGLINNAWGGSACEAWIRRDLFDGKEIYAPLVERWKKMEAEYDFAKEMAKFKAAVEAWKKQSDEAKAAGKQPPPHPHAPQDLMKGNQRLANLYHGRLKPVMPYAIRGAIWYQGETNAGRAYQYREMFPLMIQNWRDDWGQGDFPFYWVQLADFKAEATAPGDADWAELREAQTMTMSKLPHTGEAVIIDVGEANDIHPRHKLEAGRRLARWALARDYAVPVAHHSPTYESMEKQGGKIIVSFKDADGLRSHDVNEVRGFAIAGDDKAWKWASAKIIAPNKVEVSSPDVPHPAAVRYGWADNPVCNLYSKSGLPVTPFRTDDWPGVTANNR